MNLCPNCCNADLENNICPKCGYKLGTEERSVSHLPYGVILQNRYFIGKVLGEGGFGITYLGFDTRLGLKIAVKEYYPTGFVSRESNANTHTVHSFVGSKEEVFKSGLERFLKEAKRLTKFDKSNGVVSVKDVFSENNTAYIVMEFIEGTSLSNILKTAGKVSEKSTLEMFIPIIKTLAQMHAEGIIHRDIAPDNIMVQPDGAAKLIDFGAAIESDSNSDGKSTVALVKHGYAAEENYDNHHTRQGTWTDVYSLCASMYKTLTGTVPPDAMDRLRGTPLPEITVPVSETVKKAIYQGMAVTAKDRIQTMTELLDRLEGKNEPAPAPVSEPVIKAEVPVPAPKTETVTETVQAPAPVKKAKSRKPFIIFGSITAAIVLIVGVVLYPALTGYARDSAQQEANANAKLAFQNASTYMTKVQIAGKPISSFEMTGNLNEKKSELINPSDISSDVIEEEDFEAALQYYMGSDNGGVYRVILDIQGNPMATLWAADEKTSAVGSYPIARSVADNEGYINIDTIDIYEANGYVTTTATETTTAATTTAVTTTTAATTTTAKTPEAKLVEEVYNFDDGSIQAYSHLTDDDVAAGFVIDYISNKRLAVVVPKEEGGIIAKGEAEMLYIDLDKNSPSYGSTFIGPSIDGKHTGQIYTFSNASTSNKLFKRPVQDGDYADWHREWTIEFDGKETKTIYYNLEDGSEKSNSTIKPVIVDDTTLWYAADTWGYMDNPNYSGYFLNKDGVVVKNKFGYYQYPESSQSFRGQYENNERNGLGIETSDDKTLIIGQYKDNKVNGYGLLRTAEEKYYFCKYENNVIIWHKEITGIELDISIFYK